MPHDKICVKCVSCGIVIELPRSMEYELRAQNYQCCKCFVIANKDRDLEYCGVIVKSRGE